MKINFFTKEPFEQLLYEQYTKIDINILQTIGDDVIISNSFRNISWTCDVYYSWWVTGSIIPLLVGLIRRKPVIVVVGGNEALLTRDSISGNYFGYGSFKSWKKLIVKFVLRFATRLLTVSEFSKHQLSDVTSRESFMVYNAVDLGSFYALDLRTKDFSCSKFLTVCRLDAKPVSIKRLENLLRAFAILLEDYPDASLSIVGASGNSSINVENLIQQLALDSRVKHFGKVPNDEMPNVYRNHDCYVQISDVETFGVAVVEAMASLLPLLLSRAGALPEVSKGQALFVDQNSIKDILSGLHSVCAGEYPISVTERQALRNIAKRDYSFDARRVEIEKIFAGVLNDK